MSRCGRSDFSRASVEAGSATIRSRCSTLFFPVSNPSIPTSDVESWPRGDRGHRRRFQLRALILVIRSPNSRAVGFLMRTVSALSGSGCSRNVAVVMIPRVPKESDHGLRQIEARHVLHDLYPRPGRVRSIGPNELEIPMTGRRPSRSGVESGPKAFYSDDSADSGSIGHRQVQREGAVLAPATVASGPQCRRLRP